MANYYGMFLYSIIGNLILVVIMVFLVMRRSVDLRQANKSLDLDIVYFKQLIKSGINYVFDRLLEGKAPNENILRVACLKGEWKKTTLGSWYIKDAIDIALDIYKLSQEMDISLCVEVKGLLNILDQTKDFVCNQKRPKKIIKFLSYQCHLKDYMEDVRNLVKIIQNLPEPKPESPSE